MTTTNALLQRIATDLADMKNQFGEMKSEFGDMKSEFGEIKSEIRDIKSDLGDLKTSVNKLRTKVEDFIKRDSDITELEINSAIMKHLHTIFEGYTITPYDKQLKSVSNMTNSGKKVTEFDGLFLLEFKKTSGITKTPERLFVLIEAKHHITIKKVENKLVQLQTLNNMIETSKNDEALKSTTKKFRTTAIAHKFSAISNVMLYIGGPFWDIEALDRIKTLASTNPNIGYIELSGSRYKIHDDLTFIHGGKKLSYS